MNQTWKILIAVIITAVIVGGGVYYWQNSKTSLEAPVVEDTSNNEEESSIANESTDETANWKTYSSTGVTIKYPNDGTYTVDEAASDPSVDGFIITQEHPGNRFQIARTNNSLGLSADNTKTKIINGKTYIEQHYEGIGKPYGYSIERNGQFYHFSSWKGPTNEVFESMMTTVEFE